MTIHLTPEQERRLRAVLGHGAYKSAEEVVEAALRPLNNAACQVSREHRKNSIPCSLKGLPQNNSRKMSFGVP
jgi:Arc/MetJ-type ribon-helix-helix transcriptional regulator